MKKLIKTNISIINIVLVCLTTAILQALNFPAFSYTAKSLVAALGILIFVIYAGILALKKELKENIINLLILGSMLLHAWYVLNTGINDRQHDEGNITTLEDTAINRGHLGYIEYIYKHKALPDFNPFDVFSYYHPPLHHIIASVMVGINLILGVQYELAFENVQVLTLLYFGITMIFAQKSLLKMNEIVSGDSESSINIPALALIFFHPGLVYMSASTNNDMITMVLESVFIYLTLCYIKKKDLKTLVGIAFGLGFATIAKMNAAIYACPIGILFLMHFISEIKAGNVKEWVRNYIIFGLICAPIGVSYTVRNALLFGESPGVPTPGVDSISYTGMYTYLERFGIPRTLDLNYPFFSPYSRNDYNTWLIMLKTAFFAEVRPNVRGLNLFICQCIMILAVITCIVFSALIIYTGIKMIKSSNVELGVFQLVSFATIVITFIVFVIIYPYTCSGDFRYIPTILITTSLAMNYTTRWQKYVGILTTVLLILSNYILFIYCI